MNSVMKLSGLATVVVSLAALAVLSCSKSDPMLTLKETKVVEKVSTTPSITFDPKVDILFVVANDSSMEAYQKNLVTNAALFTQEIFKNKTLNYHIGVINAMADDQNLGAWGGRLNGNIPFITPTTPNADLELKANLKLGSQASDPVALFQVVRLALTPPVATNENAGFLRADAALAVIFLTDTDDEDMVETPKDLYTFLLALKGGDAKKILTYGAYTQNGDPSCFAEADAGKLQSLITMTGGNSSSFSLCAPDFGKKLSQVSANIVSGIGRKLRLTRMPDAKSIVVHFGSQVIPMDLNTGWSYDRSDVSINFGEEMVLSPNEPPGTKLKVDFETAPL